MNSNKESYLKVGHRGWPQSYPENTSIGLLAALNNGADALELDIQLTSDGIPVLLHDENLKRTCGVDISIFNVLSQDLSKYSAHEPERFKEKYYETPITLLKDFCISLLNTETKVPVFIEIKRESIKRFNRERVYQVVSEASEKIIKQRVFISFDYDVLVLAQSCGEKVGWVLDEYDEYHLNKADVLAPDYLIANYKKINTKKLLKEGPWHWFLYDICEIDLANNWWHKGAKYIETWDIKSL